MNMEKKRNSEKESIKKRSRTETPYEVVDPRINYRGKSYSEWASDWLNWFLSENADKRNSGPVVFLRSHGLPNRVTGAYISDEAKTDILPDGHTDLNYPNVYVNDPNIRIGSDKLLIFEDQAVLVPIITAYQFASVAPYGDWGNLQDFTGLLIDNGDDPPDPRQLTINNENIQLPQMENYETNKDKMEQFRITTPIFTAVVPDAPYGTSIKDFLEGGPVAPGSYPAMVEGYFVMLKFKRPGKYLVHSWASAGREVKGPYFSELLYEIEVHPKVERHGMITTTYPARNEAMINRILNTKKEIGELTDPEVRSFQSFPEQIKTSLTGPIDHNGPIKTNAHN